MDKTPQNSFEKFIELYYPGTSLGDEVRNAMEHLGKVADKRVIIGGVGRAKLPGKTFFTVIESIKAVDNGKSVIVATNKPDIFARDVTTISGLTAIMTEVGENMYKFEIKPPAK